ncbi:unnamed protein product [Didymodactylos carnosus]|uniref:Uncharacterized protein n=1 Tax=Didymodactylos carnosus TaxID=1234261 RepID=A0A816E9B6_9BILA|nr:unnamed protein product [Didymodactylos carnosus]CAF4574964.1 unnamed protein product [Didymodactylos carnosus]
MSDTNSSSTLSETIQLYLYRFTPNGIEKETIFIDWEDEKWSIGSENFGIDMNTWSISVKRSSLNECMQYFCLCSSLIIRFDTLYNEIFKKQLNGIEENSNDYDLLSDEIDLEEMSIEGTKRTEKKPTIVISSI